MKPRIFISTVSSELKSARQLTANVLQSLGYEPVWQDIFGTEPGDLKQMLRDKIDDCEGLIQIVGRAYGAEPLAPDLEFGRVSYTQFEFLYARQRGKTTWVLFADEGCTRDKPLDQLDLPRDAGDADPAAYQAERRAHQEAWRQRLQQDGHLRHAASSDTELELKIERLRSAFAELRRGFRRWQRLVLGVGVAGLLLTGSILVALWWSKRTTEGRITRAQRATDAGIRQLDGKLDDVKKGQTISATRIRLHLLEASERARDAALAEADKEPRFDERERLRAQALKAHEIRLGRIDELAASFVALERQADTSPVLREMIRILHEEKSNGVDKAIAYAEAQRPLLLARVRARKQAEQERNRTDLEPLLKLAALEQTNARPAAARARFQEVLDLEPDWPQALERYAYFLYDQSVQSHDHGLLRGALADAESSLRVAERLHSRDESNPEGQRVVSVACTQLGDVLVTRGQRGDAERALKEHTRSLALAEALRKRNPDSAQAARDVSVSLNKLGDLLAQRGQAGDAEQAIKHYTRGLDIFHDLLKRYPDSAVAARDVSAGLNSLGDLLAQRGQPGDAEQALKHHTRSLDIREDLLKRNPNSALAARDVSVSLNKLGDLLVQRGQPGDTEQALKHYTRSLEISEDLLKRNPNSALAARDVSISLERFGNLLAQRGQPGDAEQALTHYTRCLDIREDLRKRNPDSAHAARDVYVSLDRLGNLLAHRGQPGDIEQVLKYYTRSLEINEDLRKRNPGSAHAARDVSVSLEKLGDLLRQRGQPGDAEQALKHHTRSLDIREDLLKRNPNSALATRDVSVSLEKLGNLLAQRGQPGDTEQALTHYTRSLEISEDLLKRNPNSALAARDVSVSLGKLGALLVQRGQPGDAEQALTHYTRELEINEDLLKRNPDSAQTARDVTVSRYKLGELDVKAQRFGSAIAHFDAGIAVLDGMIARRLDAEAAAREKAFLVSRREFCVASPLAVGAWDAVLKARPNLLPLVLTLRVTALAQQGRLADVAQAGAKLRELEPKTGDNLYNAACAYGLCAGLAAKDNTAVSEAADAEHRRYIDLALACLKEAIAADYSDFDHMKQDTDLTVLHNLPEFQRLFPSAIPK